MGKPALALQALSKTLLRAAYYDVGADATTVSLFEVSVPTSVRLLLAVVGVLGAHLAVLALVTATFVRHATLSLLGNVWAALGQMHGHGHGDGDVGGGAGGEDGCGGAGADGGGGCCEGGVEA